MTAPSAHLEQRVCRRRQHRFPVPRTPRGRFVWCGLPSESGGAQGPAAWPGEAPHAGQAAVRAAARHLVPPHSLPLAHCRRLRSDAHADCGLLVKPSLHRAHPEPRVRRCPGDVMGAGWGRADAACDWVPALPGSQSAAACTHACCVCVCVLVYVCMMCCACVLLRRGPGGGAHRAQVGHSPHDAHGPKSQREGHAVLHAEAAVRVLWDPRPPAFASHHCPSVASAAPGFFCRCSLSVLLQLLPLLVSVAPLPLPVALPLPLPAFAAVAAVVAAAALACCLLLLLLPAVAAAAAATVAARYERRNIPPPLMFPSFLGRALGTAWIRAPPLPVVTPTSRTRSCPSPW